MSTDETCRKKESKPEEEEVVLRDLQGLLRQSISDEVTVVDFKSARLLQKGENYASTILKIDAVIKRMKDSKEENLPLIAKMILKSETQQAFIDVTSLFAKEIFVFEKLIRAYREIEKEAGIPDESLIDILPKYYGGRLSLDVEKREVDDDVVLLMENLIERGYRTMSRKIGLDFNHAKLAISELARYHALGVALKTRRPDLFSKCETLMGKFPFKGDPAEFEGVFKYTVDTACKDPRLAQYKDRISKVIADSNMDFDKIMREELIEPWITITHGDFWVNNMLFHEDDHGEADDVKFIDFQIALVGNPLKDLPYFLCANCNIEVMENHFDELLDTYYDILIQSLKAINYDSSEFTKESFNIVLKKVATNDILRCLITIRMFTTEKTDDIDLDDMKATMMMTNDSSLCIERTYAAISKFVAKEWI